MEIPEMLFHGSARSLFVKCQWQTFDGVHSHVIRRVEEERERNFKIES